ncbi:YpdA family putative bacillithiol disulfide reductase [Paenibacillus turpanensis]|uniref:YpdA family putative bacillithiol disulfide reductase n=1 Tax=Paenibacillus turpanensis TaxID=2689078 RepID=UPI00140CB01D|nr:YpdA family putative bacillithiol disulfide reductase [Paenibacillus turpanensis]
MEDIIIVGAGPCGLSAALELQAVGYDPLIIEKHVVVHSIYQYPTYMHFFSTPELLEIGGIPFSTPNEKPSRVEALHYYRNVAKSRNVRINQYEEVFAVQKTGEHFQVHSRKLNGETAVYESKKVIISVGYFDHPNRLGIPGEELPKVSHFFREAHPYTGMKVAIIGGSNSAVDAALELMRVGAKVTVVYRGSDYSPYIKPWVRPTFESMVRKGIIDMRFSSRVIEIDQRQITIQRSADRMEPESAAAAETEHIENDFVLALTGFRPDRSFLQRMGVRMEETEEKPGFNPETMETDVPGLYLAGVIAAGREANEIFIETGRYHGRKIAEHLQLQSMK